MKSLAKSGFVARDLYNFTRIQNIDIAKKNMVDCVYSSARLENIGVSYRETEQLCSGIAVGGLTITEVNKVNNLHQGWEFILATAEYPLDFMYLQKLNQIVNTALVVPDAGNVRKQNSLVRGVDKKIGAPDRTEVKDELIRIMYIPSVTERAIRMLLYIMKTRIFSVGNKRTAQLAANQILVREGKGYLRIPEEKKDIFLDLLTEYYLSSDMARIRDFVYSYCICGA